MDGRRKMAAGAFVAGLIGTLVVLAAIALAVAYSGAYNVAATEEHLSPTRWLFDTTMRNAVQSRADELTAPESITPAMLETGAARYKETCQHCHAGPGVERSEWAGGMRPRPPHLTEAAAEWTVEEVFWLARHGIKMTGMPAFGPTHDDETLWGIAAFVKQLPAMTPEEYAATGAGNGEGHAHQDGTR